MANQNNTNNSTNHGFETVIIDFCEQLLKALFLVSKEILFGLWHGTMPFFTIGGVSLMIVLSLKTGFDQSLWSIFGKIDYYPEKLYRAYWWFLVSSPLWGWGIYSIFFRRRMENEMGAAFATAGLKDRNDKTPTPIFDKKLNNGLRKIRVSNKAFTSQQFEKSKGHIESSLGGYVERIDTNRAGRYSDVYISKNPMPRVVAFRDDFLQGSEFLVGKTLTKKVIADLEDTPHFLIAGQTGGGKSTSVSYTHLTLPTIYSV